MFKSTSLSLLCQLKACYNSLYAGFQLQADSQRQKDKGAGGGDTYGSRGHQDPGVCARWNAGDVSDIRRRVIDLETDTVTRREFKEFKTKVLPA